MTLAPDITPFYGLDTDRAWLTLEGYARHVGKTDRTIRRWLAAGELPDAVKVADGSWCIPADAQRTETPAGTLDTLFAPKRGELERHITAAELLDTLPSFVELAQASDVLGITEYAIRRHPEYFDLVPFGAYGALVMPLATIKRIRG